MDLKRVRNFIVVVESGSIKRAAETLHIAQPALSAQMRQLEDVVGVQLIARSSKGVMPTAVGLEFCRKGKEVLRQAEALRYLPKDMAREPEGRVTVGCPTSVSTMIAVPLIEAVSRGLPRVELELLEVTSGELARQLLEGRLDISILFSDNLVAGLHHQAVLEEDLFIVAPQALPDEAPLSLLNGLSIVMPARPNNIRALLEEACAQRNVSPLVIAEVSSPHAMLRLAHAGLAAAVLPWSSIGHARPKGLQAARIVAPRLTRTICIATRSDVPQSERVVAIRALLADLLRRVVAESNWSGARLKTRSRSSRS